MINVTLYRRVNCEACDQAEADLEALQGTVPHRLVTINLDDHPELAEHLGGQAPVIEVGPYKLRAPFQRQDLLAALGAANDRVSHLERVGDTRFKNRVERGQIISSADRFSLWLSHHYMLLFTSILLLYVGVPFLAPVFMKIGAQSPAKVIYTIYSPLCHQWAFRSWFLFGEQPAYPREIAQVKGLIPYEEATGLSSLDTVAARNLIGNPTLGYKVAFCERDVAIYSSLMLFGVLFTITGKRLKSLPWYLWVMIGILPIGLDGVSQIPSLLAFPLFSWLPIRESTPLLRTITGFLFGFATGWYGFPIIESSMRETRLLMARKIAIINRDLK